MRRRLRRKRFFKKIKILVTILMVYGIAAYFAIPAIGQHQNRRDALHASQNGTNNTETRRMQCVSTTNTREGFPGDPVNIALLGTRADVAKAFLKAGWKPADPLTLHTALGITKSVLTDHPYPTAPVSRLYLWGRPQDLVFEKSVESNVFQRHHVRLWKSQKPGPDGRPVWIGAATFDRSVGVSRRTGQITHHIAADIDTERDALVQDLKKSGQVINFFEATRLDKTVWGKNGAGDYYKTDGDFVIGVLKPS